MQFKRNHAITIFLLLSIAFVILSIFISKNPILPSDIRASLFIQQFHPNWLDKVMLAISLLGEIPYSLVSILIVAAIFYWKKFRRESYFIASILLSGLIILGVKSLVNRPRPTDVYVRLVEVNRFESFPSGHVLSYMLFFGFLIILMSKLESISDFTRSLITYISAFLIIMIAPSRIYLGAHWLTDTLGGYLLGLICLIPLAYFYLNKKTPNH